MTAASTQGPALVRHVLTARDSQARLSDQPPLAWGQPGNQGLPTVFCDAAKQFQTLEGFGGAFTEAAAVTLNRLSPARRRQALEAYFDPRTGHGYTLCRTHINSCDFATGNYAYDEVPGDTALKHFSLDRDRQALLPLIREAQAIRGGLKLLASPWSPPAWMKTTGMMNQGGKLRPEYRQAWADYYVRYVQEYAREGVPIWALTVQNEPEAKQTWDSCLYSAEEERDFVRDYLGPALERAGLLGQVRLCIWDHNRDVLVERVHPVYEDPQAARYVWGAAFHWYVADKFENLNLVHDCWPDKHLLFSEGCQEGGPHLGSWATGERYARSLIHDLNRWTVGWIDWNLVLDERGGPNHVGNYCSAPIIADTGHDQLLFQSSYYYLGHFSRFVQPDARRILCASSRDELEAFAARNADGSVAVVVLNRQDREQRFCLRNSRGGAAAVLPGHAIATYLLPADIVA